MTEEKQNDAIEAFKEKQCLFIGAKYVQFTHDEADTIRTELERAQRMRVILQTFYDDVVKEVSSQGEGHNEDNLLRLKVFKDVKDILQETEGECK